MKEKLETKNYVFNQIFIWVTMHNENILSDTRAWMTSHKRPTLKTLECIWRRELNSSNTARYTRCKGDKKILVHLLICLLSLIEPKKEKKKEPTTTWMNLGSIILSKKKMSQKALVLSHNPPKFETSKTKKKNLYLNMHIYIW